MSGHVKRKPMLTNSPHILHQIIQNSKLLFYSSIVLFFDKERHCYTIIWNSCEQNFIEKDYFMPKGHEAARKVQRKIKTMYKIKETIKPVGSQLIPLLCTKNKTR